MSFRCNDDKISEFEKLNMDHFEFRVIGPEGDYKLISCIELETIRTRHFTGWTIFVKVLKRHPVKVLPRRTHPPVSPRSRYPFLLRLLKVC